jgi:2TM domain
VDDPDDRRQAALRRLEDKRDFRTHIAVYLIVNTMLVIIWAASGSGYFWPIWPIVGWGVGIAIHAWRVYFERPITEADIQREMDRDR